MNNTDKYSLRQWTLIWISCAVILSSVAIIVSSCVTKQYLYLICLCGLPLMYLLYTIPFGHADCISSSLLETSSILADHPPLQLEGNSKGIKKDKENHGWDYTVSLKRQTMDVKQFNVLVDGVIESYKKAGYSLGARNPIFRNYEIIEMELYFLLNKK